MVEAMRNNRAIVVATCTIQIHLHGVQSLKQKRSVVKSILARLPQQFNLAVAEVDYHDIWQSSLIGLATVGNDPGYLHGLLEKAVEWICDNRPDIEVVQYAIDFR